VLLVLNVLVVVLILVQAMLAGQSLFGSASSVSSRRPRTS
jgi:hypothetical protein